MTEWFKDRITFGFVAHYSKFKKKNHLFSLCSLFPTTYFDDQNKSEARELEGLV